MTENNETLSAATLLDKLSDSGFEPEPDAAGFIIEQSGEPNLPIYLRILVGIGAFVAAMCFIGFLALGELINIQNEMGLLVWGVFFLGIAIWFKRLSASGETLKHSFFNQCSFALIATGKIVFVVGIAMILESIWGVPLGLLLVTAATYFTYRTTLDRVLSVFALLYSVLFAILWDKTLDGITQWYLNGYILAQYLLAALLLTYPKLKRTLAPIANALVLSLCASVVLLITHKGFVLDLYSGVFQPVFINITFTAGLIGLIAWANGGLVKLRSEPLILAIAGALALGVVSAPGILLAITLLVLGYAKHELLSTVLGALLIPVFMWVYYYSIDVSLLQKSAILAGSGAVLLAGWGYLKYRGWDTIDGKTQEHMA